MIVSKIQGGIGNQIFQWAYGRSIELEFKKELKLDISFFLMNSPGSTNRTFSLNKFPSLGIDILQHNMTNLIRIDDDFNFKEINFDKNLNYYLLGYWQSEKYFKKHSDNIIKELSPRDTQISKLVAKYPNVLGNSVSIHIRRTDYLTSNGYHPVLDIDYYKLALSILGDDYDDIFVFSDDINWCKKELNFKNAHFVDGNDDVEDIWLMSMCKNNIIANSTFSWWGAYLNNNKNKKVIAPNKWFGESVNIKTGEIIPNNWIKI